MVARFDLIFSGKLYNESSIRKYSIIKFSACMCSHMIMYELSLSIANSEAPYPAHGPQHACITQRALSLVDKASRHCMSADMHCSISFSGPAPETKCPMRVTGHHLAFNISCMACMSYDHRLRFLTTHFCSKRVKVRLSSQLHTSFRFVADSIARNRPCCC